MEQPTKPKYEIGQAFYYLGYGVLHYGIITRISQKTIIEKYWDTVYKKETNKISDYISYTITNEANSQSCFYEAELDKCILKDDKQMLSEKFFSV